MKKTDTTLASARNIVKRTKAKAADRATSISAMLKHLLGRRPRDHQGYKDAHQRQSAVLNKGFTLGTKGEPRWTRQQLHDRLRESQERDVLGRYDRLVERMAAHNESYSDQEVAADVLKASGTRRSR